MTFLPLTSLERPAPTLRRKRSIRLWAAACSLAFSAAGFAADPPAPAPLAIVNGVPLPQVLFDRAMTQQLAMGRRDTPELRRLVREELIAQELLHQEALRLKLDESPGFVAALEDARRTALATMALQSPAAPAVTEPQVRAAYDRSVAGLWSEDQRLRAIAVADEARLKALRSRLARGDAFEDLAVEHSRLPSAKAGGDMGWMNVRRPGDPTGPLPEPVAAEVRKLAKGGYTPPVADGRGGWWIVRLDDSRPAQALPYEQAAPRIRRVLETTAHQRAGQALLARLRSQASVVDAEAQAPTR